MINGNSVILQAGKETTYGTAAVATNRINFSTADFKWTPNKKDEGLLTGGKTTGKVETMSIKTTGSISTLAKPEITGLFLKGALGVETVGTADATTGKTPHTFTAIGNAESDELPSFTFIMDKKASVNAYTGCKIDELSFSASPEDYLKIDVSLVGKEEETGTLVSSLVAETAKAFKFRQGKAYIGSTELADITSIKFNYKNNLDSSTQTTSTGKYFKEPSHGSREITNELELLYSSTAETFRTTWYKTDDVLTLKLEFTDEDNDVLTITLPACQVSTMENPSVSSADTLKQSLTVKAVDSSSELITAVLTNSKATEY